MFSSRIAGVSTILRGTGKDRTEIDLEKIWSNENAAGETCIFRVMSGQMEKVFDVFTMSAENHIPKDFHLFNDDTSRRGHDKLAEMGDSIFRLSFDQKDSRSRLVLRIEEQDFCIDLYREQGTIERWLFQLDTSNGKTKAMAKTVWHIVRQAYEVLRFPHNMRSANKPQANERGFVLYHDPCSAVSIHIAQNIAPMFAPHGDWQKPEFQDILRQMYESRGSVGGFLDTWFPDLSQRM